MLLNVSVENAFQFLRGSLGCCCCCFYNTMKWNKTITNIKSCRIKVVPTSCQLHVSKHQYESNKLPPTKMALDQRFILAHCTVSTFIHTARPTGIWSGFGIRKTRACDNRTPRLKIQRLQTCEKSHATHQVGVWWRAMIIPFRTPQFSFFYNEIYKL